MKKIALLSLLASTLTMQATKDTVQITNVEVNTPAIISTPWQEDSINLSGNKPDHALLLKAPLLPSNAESSFTPVVANEKGLFSLQKPSQEAALQLVKFNITLTEYTKISLETSTTAAFELYVNGKKESYKSTVEDSLSSSSKNSTSLTLTPQTYEVVYKLLTSSTQKQPSTLSIAVVVDSTHADVISTSLSKNRMLTINDMIEGTRPSSISLSPNGRWALVTYTTIADGSWTRSSYSELIDVSSRNVHLRDYGNRADLRWMPKSNKLSFTRKTTERELILLDPQTLKEETLAPIPEGHYSWCPDEQSLIFSIYEHGRAEKGDLMEVRTPADRQEGWRNRYFLHKYDLSTRILQPLTFGTETTSLNHFSSDGKKIIFSTHQSTLTQWPLSRSSFYVMDLMTLKVDTLFSNVAHINQAQFSPDGNFILFLGTALAFDQIGNTLNSNLTPNLYDIEAFIMNIETKEVTCITKEFDPCIQSATWSRYEPGKIYFRCTDKEYGRVYTYDVRKERFDLLKLDVDVVWSFDIAETAPVALYWGQSVSTPTQVYTFDLKKRHSALLSFPQKERFEQWQLGSVETFDFTAENGTTINGRYYLPHNFNPEKKYPMIVYYYGGTTPVDRTLESRYPLHLYASMGYVVYTLQPSGTIGWGQEFAARHVNAWGEKTADEIIEGTRRICSELPFVDSTRIGCIGASYGGFMTQYLISQCNLFRAAVSHAGISALSSYWGEGYWGFGYSSIATAQSFPWNRPDIYTRQSPLFSADKINTPLLLLHGMEDTNVPIGESIQMFTALKMLGKEVRFVQVKGENHAISAYKKRIEWNNTIFAWFAKQLQGNNDWWNELYPETIINR